MYRLQGVYGNLMCHISDLKYTETLVRYVIAQVLNGQAESFPLGQAAFPLPPGGAGQSHTRVCHGCVCCGFPVHLLNIDAEICALHACKHSILLQGWVNEVSYPPAVSDNG